MNVQIRFKQNSRNKFPPLTNQWTASRNFVISNQSAYAPLVNCHAITEFQAQTKSSQAHVLLSQMTRIVCVPALLASITELQGMQPCSAI